MGRVKMLSIGVFFCLMSNVQALVFEIPIFPGIEGVVAPSFSDWGLKVGVPFLGGTCKHSITFGGFFKDVKYAFEASNKVVIHLCIGTFFRDSLNKKIAITAAVFLKQPLLEKKLKEFYVLREQLKKSIKNGSASLEEKKRYVLLKREIKALIVQ